MAQKQPILSLASRLRTARQWASVLRLCRALIAVVGWHRATILADQDMYLQDIIDDVHPDRGGQHNLKGT